MFSSCPEKLYLKTTPLSCTESSSSLLPVLCSALTLSLSRKAGGKEGSSYRKAFQSQVLGWKGVLTCLFSLAPVRELEQTTQFASHQKSPQRSSRRQRLTLIESYLSQCQREQFLLQTQQCHLWPQLWQPDFFPLAEIPVREERWARIVGSWP